jgi:lysophospholipase L1-like esterase
MTPIVHNYSHAAGKTVNWDTSDSEMTYLKNIQDSVRLNRLQELDFYNVPIQYQFNSHGFRSAEFDHPAEIVCFGCSFTMGTGVHAQDTWPSQLQLLTGLTVANLGHAGSSNDTAFRLANHYLKWLKPKYAIWQQIDMHRLELLDDLRLESLNILATDTHNPCADDYYVKTWFSSPSNQELNLLKNTMALKQLCDSLQIQLIVVPRKNIPKDHSARDLMHPGAAAYKTLAKQVVSLLGL